MSGFDWIWPDALSISGGILLLAITGLSLRRSFQRLWRRSRPRWLLVAACSGLASLALAALFNPPSWQRPGGGTALLTEGAEADGLAGEIFATGDVGQDLPQVSRLLHAAQLPLRKPALTRLEIRGHGLRAAELEALPVHLDIDFAPAELEGIVDIQWPRQITVGTLARVSGRYLSGQDGLAVLKLLDPAGRLLASETLKPDDRFDFVFRPSLVGLTRYQLTLENGQKQTTNEPLMIEVREAQPIRLFVQQSAPSFDTRQLRRWAGDQGSQIWVRTEITKDRWLTQGTNVPADELDVSMTPSFLSRMDLFIIDGRSWMGLDAGQRAMITTAVEQGLGLMLLADAPLAQAPASDRGPLLAAFQLGTDPGGASEAVITIPGLESESAMPLAPFEIAVRSGQPLLIDTSGTSIEAWAAHGAGGIGVSRLRERHRWITRGEAAQFGAYWSQVLRTLARPRPLPYFVDSGPRRIERPGEQSRLCTMGDGRALALTLRDPSGQVRSLTLSRDSLESPLACAWFWPAAAGWHHAELLDAATGERLDHASAFVYTQSDWKTAEFHRRQQRMLDRMDEQHTDGTHRQQRASETAFVQPLNPVWPWLLFLFCAAFLWVERRLDS